MEIGDDAEAVTAMSRKEKRKLLKKEKRQQRRKEIAVREKEAEERRLSDAEVQSKLRQLEEEELEKTEMDRKEFEERERTFLQALELNRRPELQEYRQEPVRERQLGEVYRGNKSEDENAKEMENESDWEYAEEGPAEIIWKGNEIIVKKKRVRVPKKNFEEQNKNEDVVRPISNPLAPQSEDFEDCKSVQQILDTVAQEVPYFGTEQDKAHCPFHLKTGACRFGTHCSRVHFYPDKSCTLLMKNMYGGHGLIWEQDEGLEHTDEEIEHSFEEFYEDVHTEFLKFGEIVNFKVCRNGSSHLRGNVYVHYKSLESAVLSYKSTNGRYFAGKQVLCEFVNLTRWKVAICGEYMRSRLMTCSRGSTCNFIHCFRNPGGDYEWADWDRKPPAYWINKMNALFGNYDGYGEQLDELSRDRARSAARSIPTNADRHYSRSRPKELDWRHTALYDDNDYRNSTRGGQWRSMGEGRENSFNRERHEVKMGGVDNRYVRRESSHLDSGDDKSDREVGRTKYEGKYAHKNCRRIRWLRVERNSESSSDGDISVEDGRERFRQDYKSLRSKPDSNGKSTESDLGREWSGKDGTEEYPEDETISSQKTRDSCRSDYEGDIREDILIGNLEDYHEDNICKHHRHRSKSNLQEDRRRSSRGSKQAHASGWDKQRKRERSHPKSESRRSRSRKDRPGPNVTLSDKDAWDQIKVNDELVTAHFERKTCNHEDSVMELEFKKEQACRLAALEKLQQLQKLPISLNSRHVEGAMASSKVSGDNNEI